MTDSSSDFPALRPSDEMVVAYISAFDAAQRTPRRAGEAERFGLSASLRIFVQSLEGPRGAGLCDCADTDSEPTNPQTHALMAHHCDCRAVATVEALLGSRGSTLHARECICWTSLELPDRKDDHDRKQQ